MQNFNESYQIELNDDIREKIPSLEQIENIIKEKFIGLIEQVPPVLSAIKINGKKACDLVRKNIDVKMIPRNITIYDIVILDYNFPILKLHVKCSKGTYIRTLGQDLGKALGLWGTLISLRRVKSGDYSIDSAIKLESIKIDDIVYDQ
jgi:tRNA pseudouridine55 synthase